MMIKFIYFDVGGVVIKDFSGTDKWFEMKKVMGVKKVFEKEFDQLYNQYEKDGLCLNRPVDSLIPIFAQKFKMGFPPNFSMLDYFINHFEKNSHIWPIIRKVKKYKKVGLLTNMYLGMLERIKERDLISPIDWDLVIDSTEVGLQKPDPNIFKLAQKKTGVKSPEILFVDNSQRNIDAAGNIGWQTFFYDSTNHKQSCQRLAVYIESLNNKL